MVLAIAGEMNGSEGLFEKQLVVVCIVCRMTVWMGGLHYQNT